MKKIFLLLALFSLSIFSFADILKPVKWEFKSEEIGNGEFYLVLSATIDKGWHLYSQNIAPDGPIPTSFKFKAGNDYELIGKVEELSKLHEKNEPVFDMILRWFEGEAIFKQKVKLKSNTAIIKGELEFMVCNDHECLAPATLDFEFSLKSSSAQNTITSTNEQSPTNNEQPTLIENTKPEIQFLTTPTQSSYSLWTIFLGGFLGGLLALLTPCVFPMVPLTVSFFTKRSKTKAKGITNGWIYALSIIVIYVALGFIVTKSFGSDALNELASNGIFNMAFFIIFVVFAISFFGAFEITLPSSWINKTDSASEKGGLLGIFFMAFTLALVSFSCTGPIIGTLLVQAAISGHNAGPLIGMFGFSLALAIPFGFFSAFPGWLHSLPKSGGWLNSVKVVLGFLELALALKFLSNVDLAYHWGILPREIFLVIWIVIFALLGFYLLGKLKFSHDSDLKHISIPRLFFAILSFSFTLYLIPGLWGAPLKLISGFPPPLFYREWTPMVNASSNSETKTSPGHSATCPHNINCFHDYDEGMKYAKENSKPVMIDFTGWTCVNCRKMEDNVWSDAVVLKLLSQDYVLISLYVDDKTTLPDSLQYISSFSGKKIKTTGNRWSDLQASKYNTNSQPYYVLLDNEGNMLATPSAYDLDIQKYVEFLDGGLEEFKKRTKK